MAARGGLLKLLDAYIAIGGDASEFDRVVAQSEAKAKAAGDRIEGAFSPRRVLGALAVASAAAFGVMTKGGLELNETLTNVQARSGAVGAQWDAMSAAIQRQNRGTTLSLAEIGDGVAAIKTDLGATADEIGMASDRLTDFSLVAQESFGAAVRGADDLRDAYETTLLEALGILDALVVSQQTWGGSLTANRDALVALAPAIRAANLEWTDALALINLFNAAGVDAAAMPVALQRALTQVHSPAELKALIADISATEDPFLRAEKAAELFGSRAGAKMAAALAPGRGALEDYVVGVEESAGATETAARKIDSSWRRMLDLIVQNVTGFLAQIGNATGPILGIAGSVGSAFAGLALMFPGIGTKLVGGLATMFARITPAVALQAGAMGTASGGAFGTMFTAAAAVAAIAAPVAIILVAQGPIADWLGLSGKQTGPAGTWSPKLGGAFTTPVPVELVPGNDDASAQAFRDYLAGLPKGVKGLDYSEWKKAGLQGGAAVTSGAAAGVAGGAPAIAAAAAIAFGGIPTGIAGLTSATRQAIAANLAAAASELRNQRTGIDALIDQVNESRKKKPLTQTQELERLLQARASKALSEELHSPDRARRADAKALAAQLDAAIADLRPRTGIMSEVSKGLVADLEKSTNPELKGFAAWFQLQLAAEIDRQAALAAIPKNANPDTASPGVLAAARQAAIRAGINGEGSQVVASAALHELLKAALESADPLIRADARAEGSRFGAALADSIDDPQSKSDATASMRELVAAAVAYLRSGEAQALVANAWHALVGGLPPLPVPGLPAPAPALPGNYGQGFASGTPYVARDMLAVIHHREAVLTVSQADDWRAGRGGAGPREQHINIEHVEIADAHDEFSLTQQLQFLAQAG